MDNLVFAPFIGTLLFQAGIHVRVIERRLRLAKLLMSWSKLIGVYMLLASLLAAPGAQACGSWRLYEHSKKTNWVDFLVSSIRVNGTTVGRINGEIGSDQRTFGVEKPKKTKLARQGSRLLMDDQVVGEFEAGIVKIGGHSFEIKVTSTGKRSDRSKNLAVFTVRVAQGKKRVLSSDSASLVCESERDYSEESQREDILSRVLLFLTWRNAGVIP